MEQRSTLPLIVFMTIGFIGLVVVNSIFFKPTIPEAGVDPTGSSQQQDELAGENDSPDSESESNEPGESKAGEETAEATPPRPDLPREFVVLGSFQDDAPPIVATFDTRGATIRRLELNARRKNGAIKYTDVDYRMAYIGHLELETDQNGCKVQVVTEGSPAAKAGIQKGDVIRMIDGEPVVNPDDFEAMLAEIKPGTEIQLAVRRGESDVKLTATSEMMPIQVIRPTNPELLSEYNLKRRAFQFTLRKQIPSGSWPDLDAEMRSRNWESKLVETETGAGVEFTYDLPETKDGDRLQAVKRFSLAKDPERSFHLNMDLEIRNLGDQPTKVNFELCGPTGMPQEGWWYQMKIHGGTFAFFKTAGARDITMRSQSRPFQFFAGPQIVTDKSKKKLNGTVLVEKGAPAEDRNIKYLGVDTLYFNVALLPKDPDFRCYSAFGMTSAQLDEVKSRRNKLTDISYVLYSEPIALAPYDESNPSTVYKQSFEIFAGPKDPDLLEKYGLGDTRTFGWFAMFSKPLIWLLHLLYKVTFGWSYGLAIILLTVIVRLCMVPISRKAALNAQMMQYLAPQMKELQEKHKEDPRKFFQARSELCSRYNYKPLGGCLLMFIQLPIFLGLYRGLSVDVELRNAPLVNGLDWCTNLGGPDKLFEWQSWMPSFLGGETGFLGPYFNLLPVIAIVLMFMQQKLFMPPATDDQTAMAQKMMKFMMIFIGFIFFKVAAGLCIYFVTSSIWGIVERKMLPKPELDTSRFEDGGGSGKSATATESMPLRNDKELDERKRRDRDRKRKLKQRK